MRDFLTLCGYEADELAAELPRISKAFSKLGINSDDIARGKQRLVAYYDMTLKGVQKLFNFFLRDLVNLTLSREEGKEKLIYGCMAPSFDIIGSMLATNSHDVYVAEPNPVFLVVFGCIFDKIVPILEAAESRWLKGGVVGHCAMVKTRLGLYVLDLIPKPDLLVTSGSLCDASPKTNDLLEEFYGIPTYCYDTSHDGQLQDHPGSARAVNLLTHGIRGLTRKLGEMVGLAISDDMLWEILRVKVVLDTALARLYGIIQGSDPLVITPSHENLFMWVKQLPLDLEGLQRMIAAVNILSDELQERVDHGIGVVEKGAPRILAILPPNHADPRLEYLANEIGLAIVATDVGEASPVPGSATEAPDDPYLAMSLFLQSSLYSHLGERLSLILGACRRLKIDGVLDHYHVGCRSVAGDAFIIRDTVQKELGIPVLLLEWENFDPRVYNHEKYKTRLEVFKSMVKEAR